MTRLERIDAARSKFFEYYEEGADEWSETFSLGVDFARRLCDTSEEALCVGVIEWLETTADAVPQEGDDDES